jgi:hypothetical protein
MGKRRNILATGVTKASPRPNITEGRMSATAGNPRFSPPPSKLAHRANDGLPAGVNVHVFDGNFLLPLPAIALQDLSVPWKQALFQARQRTGAANFSASGLKRQDNDLIVVESAEAATRFKRNFDARFASGEALAAVGR